MSPHKTEQYKAYVKATNTIAKTRQIVMLYDGMIRFMKQAATAIHEKRIEERYKLTVKTSEVIRGLQGSIDFENGNDIANILNNFYINIARRVLSLNFIRDISENEKNCNEIIAELKQMRDVWEEIDRSLGESGSTDKPDSAVEPPASVATSPDGITLSA